jgi:hypothetical protein
MGCRKFVEESNNTGTFPLENEIADILERDPTFNPVQPKVVLI